MINLHQFAAYLMITAYFKNLFSYRLVRTVCLRKRGGEQGLQADPAFTHRQSP